MKLFEKINLGNLNLNNRLVMAPMTRSRAINNLANDLIVQYYTQRASAGLIVTEGISPSKNGLGYARIPGLYNESQCQSWKKVTDAVHQKGGNIFAQLMHTGRVSHPANMPSNAMILSSSATPLDGQIWTDAHGNQPYPMAVEMSEQQINETVQEYAKSAELAIAAGFDGVELHAANGYLIEQFLNPNVNKRKDGYGSNPEGRMRFALEVAQAVASKIGSARTGIRISPYGVFNGTGPFEGTNEFYVSLCRKFSELGLVYVHLVDHSSMGAPKVDPGLKKQIRNCFKGKTILSGGYDGKTAERDLQENLGDLIAFGRPFISNPNLVEKLKNGAALTVADHDKFYTPGAEGYVDYV